MRGALAVLVVFLLVPTVHAASSWPTPTELPQDRAPCEEALGNQAGSCIVLYALVFSLLDHGFLTTQGPPPFCPDLAAGFTTTPTISPYLGHSRTWLMPTPTFVDVVDESGCESHSFPARNTARDVHFVPGAPLFVSWYLSADEDDVSVAADPDDLDTGALPCLEVTAVLFDEWLGEGRPLAVDSARRSVLSSKAIAPRTLDRADPCAEGEVVRQRYRNLEVAVAHEFPLVLRPENLSWTAGMRPTVLLEWRQVQVGPVEAAHRSWNVHTGPAFRPRVVAAVANPLWVESFAATERNGTLLVNASLMSPFGAQDIDASAMRLRVLDAQGATVLEWTGAEAEFLYAYTGHGSAEPPLGVDFRLRLPAGLPPGEYLVRLDASNWQHSANVSAEAWVSLSGGSAEPWPV